MRLLTEEIAAFAATHPAAAKSWQPFFAAESAKPYFAALDAFVSAAYAAGPCYPPRGKIFAAFACPATAVKVVILGQDPYHEAGQAMGLAFSVPAGVCGAGGVKFPPSLRNILTELCDDTGVAVAPGTSDLTPWLGQGVFLLNTVLTVADGAANAHAKQGWEKFTAAALAFLQAVNGGDVVAILWGKPAQKNQPLFKKELVLTSAHPSPLSSYRGFFGSKPFSGANRLLASIGKAPVDWRLQGRPSPAANSQTVRNINRAGGASPPLRNVGGSTGTPPRRERS